MSILDCDWRRAWNISVGEIVARQGQPELPTVLVAALGRLAAFDRSVVFGYPRQRRPVFLYDGCTSDDQRSALAAYLRGGYLDDPFYEACRRAVTPGLYRLEDLLPPAARAGEGAHPGYVSPCLSDEPGALSEEIGFFARTGEGAYVVLSLMREAGRPPFSETEMAALREIEPLVRHLLARQWARLGAAEAEAPADRIASRIEAAIAAFGAAALTAREAEVARHILRGRDTAAIAEALRISTATVKIHRRNIYSKLGVGSQTAFFAAFLDSVRALEPRPASG